jgi:acylphosphatase
MSPPCWRSIPSQLQVQRVYFRKYTQQKAQQLGLVGWVMNTPQGTVVGEVQGHSQRVKDM